MIDYPVWARTPFHQAGNCWKTIAKTRAQVGKSWKFFIARKGGILPKTAIP
jgi:hypothetical protein